MRHDQKFKALKPDVLSSHVVTETGDFDRTHLCGFPDLITSSLPLIYPLMKRD